MEAEIRGSCPEPRDASSFQQLGKRRDRFSPGASGRKSAPTTPRTQFPKTHYGFLTSGTRSVCVLRHSVWGDFLEQPWELIHYRQSCLPKGIPFSLTYLPSPCLFPSTGDTRLGGQAVGESEPGARAAEGHQCVSRASGGVGCGGWGLWLVTEAIWPRKLGWNNLKGILLCLDLVLCNPPQSAV